MMAASTPAPARPAPGALARQGAARLVHIRGTTPGQLRLALVVLLVLLLLLAVVAVQSARERDAAAGDIQERTEPVSSAVIEAYGALAEADLAFVSESLLGSATAKEDPGRYDGAIARAAASLTSAAIQSGGRGLDHDRIADLTTALAGYTAAVERARATRTSAAGTSEVQRASDLMQTRILRQAEALQRDQSARLDDEYRRAGAPPALLLAAGAAGVAGLLIVQVLLFRRTKRVLNLGLVAATLALLATGLWWSVALSTSQARLDGSQQRSRAATDALGQAQIAARQGRASEILALVADPASAAAYDEQLSARGKRLLRDNGAGGALGAARHLASDRAGREGVEAAIGKTRAWLAAQERLSALKVSNRHEEAVAFAATGPAATAFADLDTSLDRAVDSERAGFQHDISRARRATTGIGAGTALLAVVAAVAAARGIGTRLEEYR